MRRQFHNQMDLFATARRVPNLTTTERQKAIELLRALLKEAAAMPISKPATAGQKGAGNE